MERDSQEEEYRNILSTADKSGNRIWLYPKHTTGRYTRWRTLLATLFLSLMIAGPFIKIDGEPLLLLNIVERKFVIFGKLFWTQDFQIFLLAMMAFVIFVGLFTVVYGRVFCGWICPQTIFMESVFRKVEYWIEGDWKDRMQLDKQEWNSNKILKKSLKHFSFFVLSFLIASVFLSYFIGAEKVLSLLVNASKEWGSMASLILFTLVFYWIYARFREQVCTAICPYGRLQGVLLDKKSLVVIYDYLRGEKRGKIRKGEVRSLAGKGDCIDCNHCVQVCPAGIDIRHGTQLECIHCTLCMDACDSMMKHVGLPAGLIRMDSEEGIANKKTFSFSPRVIGYSVVLMALLLVIAGMLLFRSPVETSMLRTPGTLYQYLPGNKISNLYMIKLINKTNKAMPIQVQLLSAKGEVQLIGNALFLPAQGSVQTAAFVILPKEEVKKIKTVLDIGIYSGEEQLETLSTTFIGQAH